MIQLVVMGAMLTLWGCSGAADKWVDVVNEPSGQQISARYVTRTQSVKMYQRKDPTRKVKMSIRMSDELPRVSGTRLSIHLKKFDFGFVLNSDRAGWVDILGQPGAGSDACNVLRSDVPGPAAVDQNKDGAITVTIGNPKSSDTALIYMRIDPPPSPVVCVEAFGPDKLIAFVDKIQKLRIDMIARLGEQVGFNGAQIGHRLSRKEVQFDEQTSLDVK